ncbi:MAG: hypothetical protein IKH52_05330, partial [Bacteroidaceae bacterium]|nr:hypothetical protein [Bacteroidaceae bacterium]
MADILSLDIQYIKGVGPMRARVLQKELGIATLGDLIYTFPYKYIDRSRIHHVVELTEDLPYVQ